MFLLDTALEKIKDLKATETTGHWAFPSLMSNNLCLGCGVKPNFALSSMRENLVGWGFGEHIDLGEKKMVVSTLSECYSSCLME